MRSSAVAQKNRHAFVALAILGWLTDQQTFYTALGVPTPSTHAALLLFILACGLAVTLGLMNRLQRKPM